MLNSEACYSFGGEKNKLHQHLPRSLPSRLKSAVFSVRDGCAPAWGNETELCREWSGANVSTAQSFARLPNRVLKKGLAGRQTFWEVWAWEALCCSEGNGEVQPRPQAPQEIGEIDVYWAASIGWVPWPKISLTLLLTIHLWWLMLVANLTESKITLEASLWTWVTHCSNACHHSTGQGSGLYKKKKWSWEPAFNTLCLLTVDTVWPAHLPAAVTSSVVNWTVKVSA